jgi:23S rRNA (cytidine1920-2'-O)/16S rRNA (cytidine1409-2'-O)-methyltransferase
MPKQRLDTLLVTRKLADNKSKAQALVMAGAVTVNGKKASKAGNLVDEETIIEISQKPLYVSRGGVKLAHALDEFKLDITGLTAIDVGASTGGFTDCLLQRGALRVYAIDVGYGQIDYKLRQDTRVVIMDKTNAHHVISVTKVIPNVIEHLKSPAQLIILLKPQFEAEKKEVGKGGIVKDPMVHARVIGRFILWAVNHHLRLRNLISSPITGADGNQEFLLLLEPAGDQ